MDLAPGVVIALIVTFAAARYIAARRIVARQGRFVWLLFGLPLFFSAILLWSAAQFAVKAPLFGVPLAVIWLIYLAGYVRMLSRMSRSVAATKPGDDVGAALDAPLADFTTAVMAVGLIGGLMALVGLLAWAIWLDRH